MTLETLLARGFLPKEFPPPFSTEAFASYAAAGLSVAPTPGQKFLISRPAVHNLARPAGARRRLHIPNPFNQFSLSKLLVSEWAAVDAHCTGSPLSVSVPVPDASGLRALARRCDGPDLSVIRARVRSTARFVLRTDIVRFYGSLYTHSVPWSWSGKAAAKAARHGGFANDLDAQLRNLQDGQTLGIPVGPDTSLVVAEIVATAIDKEIAQHGLTGFRFMDDYEFGFSTRAGAETALAVVEEVLAGFELGVNQHKTAIDQLPIGLDRPWVVELRSDALDFGTTSSLVGYFNRAFELKQRFPTHAVLAYAIARLRSVPYAGSWDVLTDLLCQCALAEPGAMEPVVTLLEENRASGRAAAPTIDAVIRTVLEHHTQLSHGSELTWALWSAIWFDREIPTALIERLDGMSDPAVALLALHANVKGLVRPVATFPHWEAMMTADSLYGPMWLLTYEAEMRNWLKPPGGSVVANDPNFGPMLNHGISFFDEAVQAPTKTLLLGLSAAGFAGYPNP